MPIESTREIHLAAPPRGLPTADNFSVVTVALSALKPGKTLVRNLFRAD